MTTLATTAHPALPSASSRLRTSIACNIGAAFEWYDLVIYGLFAVLLGKQFFPAGDAATSLTLSLGTFAIAYLVRPLGAMLIGAYADRRGRKSGLLLSAGLMMLGTLITALLPNYAAIGVAAPILLILARLLQGFSAGGEFGSATALLAEQDPARRGFYASLQWASSGFAVLLASLAAFAVNKTLPAAEVASWGWRLPFLFGLLIGPVALYIRGNMDESPEFVALPDHAPLLELARHDKARILAGAGIVAVGAAGSYLNIYMPSFAYTHLHLSSANALLGTIAAGLINTIFPPFFGGLSDRIGRVRLMATAGIFGMLIVYPLFLWLLAVPTVTTLICIQAILNLVFYCGYYATAPAVLAELFPPRNRTSGVSIAYVLAQLFFGGITPLVVTWLVTQTGNPASPGLYIVGAAMLSLLSLWACRRMGVK
jgi:MHS family proline/betaine transporter-like MFS transporter